MKSRKRIAAVVVVAAAALLGTGSYASAQQSRLNVAGRPNFGEREIAPGFTPDPIGVQVTSGGGLDASSMGLGHDCSGFVTAQPDFNVRLTGRSNFFRLFFEGAGKDATLIINKPDGSWVCNDDAVGTDPMVDIANAAPGLYNVWIGSYRADERIPGALKITELRSNQPGGGASATPATPVTAEGATLDVSGRPNFGERSAASGFTPDPIRVAVTSGGNIDASTSNAGSSCQGWVTSQPDFNFRLTSASRFLRFYVDNVRGNGDTTLVINTPDGRWICNDDSFGGMNPTVDLENTQPGLINVWIGSYRSGTQVQGRLNVTELRDKHP
jgi:hypothetical protein